MQIDFPGFLAFRTGSRLIRVIKALANQTPLNFLLQQQNSLSLSLKPQASSSSQRGVALLCNSSTFRGRLIYPTVTKVCFRLSLPESIFNIKFFYMIFFFSLGYIILSL